MITTWTPLNQVNKALIPDHYLSWLEKPYILSKALRMICNDFTLQVIDQSLGVLSDDEAEVLDSVETPFCLIRQTYLQCDGESHVFARVCIPHETLFRNRTAFETLGNKPIGETLLYNRTNVTRGEFEVVVSTVDNPLFNKVSFDNHGNKEIWGRRSLFIYDGSPLLVSEFFFSSIPSYMKVYEAQLNSSLHVISSERKVASI